MKNSLEKGQTLLIVVLVMVVVLTVGLSIASRTVMNLKISKQSEESQRAFQAAEAGIERALKATTDDPIAADLQNKAAFTTEVKQVQGSRILLNNNQEITQDKGHDVWLSTYPDFSNPFAPSGGNVKVYWGTPAQSCGGSGANVVPALEIIMLDLNGTNMSNPNFTKLFYDNCSRSNGAQVPGIGASLTDTTTGISRTFAYSVQVPVTNGILMKVIPIYNSSFIGVETPSGSLPIQGKTVVSTGTSGETMRKINYFVSYPQTPTEFFYAIMAQNYVN